MPTVAPLLRSSHVPTASVLRGGTHALPSPASLLAPRLPSSAVLCVSGHYNNAVGSFLGALSPNEVLPGPGGPERLSVLSSQTHGARAGLGSRAQRGPKKHRELLVKSLQSIWKWTLFWAVRWDHQPLSGPALVGGVSSSGVTLCPSQWWIPAVAKLRTWVGVGTKFEGRLIHLEVL